MPSRERAGEGGVAARIVPGRIDVDLGPGDRVGMAGHLGPYDRKVTVRSRSPQPIAEGRA